MRLHRAVLAAVLAGLSLVVVRAAIDEDRVAKVRPAASTSPSAGDCCTEAFESNYPLTPVSAGGNNCPSTHVPQGSENLFDPEKGRITISFYDAALREGRTFTLDVEDPACYRFPATRQAIFGELLIYMENGDREDACRRLRRAAHTGSLELGSESYDMSAAKPYRDEVCAA